MQRYFVGTVAFTVALLTAVAGAVVVAFCLFSFAHQHSRTRSPTPVIPSLTAFFCAHASASPPSKVVQFFEAAALAGDAAAAMQLGNLYLTGSRGVPQVGKRDEEAVLEVDGVR